jgi:hypothetical protein
VTESARLLLHICAVLISIVVALILAGMLWTIADEEIRHGATPPRTTHGMLILASRTRKGRRLLPWFILAQVGWLIAAFTLAVTLS